MIRFSKMTDYGVLLLGHFARAEGAQSSTTELAELYHLPKPVVANLLKEFGRAGLLTSRRGLHGGYRLARDPKEISLLDVLSALEGPVRLIECAADELLESLPRDAAGHADGHAAGHTGSSCCYEDVCPSRSPMQGVHRRIIDLLRSITLAELMHRPESRVPAPANAAALGVSGK
ncbi:MAG: RrF2 family transcriptional regulator [Planctomycetota bacterium]